MVRYLAIVQDIFFLLINKLTTRYDLLSRVHIVILQHSIIINFYLVFNTDIAGR